jgi:hypothetical protein
MEFYDINNKISKLMSRKTLSKNDVEFLNKNGYSATIYKIKKLVIVNGRSKFKLI